MAEPKSFSLDQATQAILALRIAAGIEDQRFTVSEFVGMISDEVEELRKLGKSDEIIAEIICDNSTIKITGAEIAQHYASPEKRRAAREG